MMNKLVKSTVKKRTLLSIVIGVVVVLAIVLTAVLGVNKAAMLDDCNTLTITVNTYAYEGKREDIVEICDKEFENQGVDYNLIKYGEMTGDDCEIVYEFDKDVDLTEAKKNLTKTFDTLTAGDWNGSFITVSVGSEVSQSGLATAYIVRAAIAVAVFAVLAFVYVALRYQLNMGILTAASALVSSVLTAALLLLVRIPLTNSFAYVVALAAPVCSTLVLLTMNKLRVALKDNKSELSNEELIIENVAVKEATWMAVLGGVSLILVGAIATTAVRWFAVCALIGLAVSLFVGVLVAPAWYLPMKNSADKKAASRTKSGYVGAEKQEKNAKTDEE